MNKIKLGFTLAELLMALTIIGICTALAATTIRPSNKTTKYAYMNAYEALQTAYYNSMLQGGNNPFTTVSENPDVEITHTEDNDTGAEMLCRSLTMYINTINSACSSDRITSSLANNFIDENIQFIASNGMRFYISNMINFQNPDIRIPRFYLVFIDINNERQPNSIRYTFPNNRNRLQDRIPPDIFAFALLDNGKVCPIGIPEFDAEILTAGINFYTGQTLTNAQNSFAYFQAKSLAWGYYSGDIDPVRRYNKDDIFSVNDVVRSSLPPASEILADLPSDEEIRQNAFVVAGENDDLAFEENPQCVEGNFEICSIYLDSYHW